MHAEGASSSGIGVLSSTESNAGPHPAAAAVVWAEAAPFRQHLCDVRALVAHNTPEHMRLAVQSVAFCCTLRVARHTACCLLQHQCSGGRMSVHLCTLEYAE